jgi:hypothetical protein
VGKLHLLGTQRLRHRFGASWGGQRDNTLLHGKEQGIDHD